MLIGMEMTIKARKKEMAKAIFLVEVIVEAAESPLFPAGAVGTG